MSTKYILTHSKSNWISGGLFAEVPAAMVVVENNATTDDDADVKNVTKIVVTAHIPSKKSKQSRIGKWTAIDFIRC